MVITRKRTQN